MKSKLLTLSAILAVMAVVGFYLQQSQAALFQYREQQQIFLIDADYIADLLRQPAGLATLMAQYLTQYFNTPGAGAILTTIVLGISGLLSWFAIKRIDSDFRFLPLALFPAFLQVAYLPNMGYHYEGLTALLFCSIALYGYAIIADKANNILRTLVGCILTAWLFLYAGSIATLFAICALVYDFLQQHGKAYLSVANLLVCLLLGAFYVSKGMIPGYDYALWVKGYCEWFTEPGIWLSLSWIALPLIMLFVWGMKKMNFKPLLHIILCQALFLAGGIFIVERTKAKTDKEFRTLAELMNAINHEDWDGIITSPDLNTSNYLHLNCLNLALSHKGKAMTDLFRVPQKGAQSLLASYQAYNDVNVLFSHIYYHTGIISESLCLSFGTMIATPNGNPSMLKLLVKERLILGDYDIAEKYITRLERTYSYRDWATSMRRFLYNDAAVEQDPELGVKRRDLPVDDHRFVVVDGVMADLMKVIGTNAQQTSAWEYALGMLMLEKNMAGIKQLVELPSFSPEIWNGTLPSLVQEAIVTYAENDADYCTAHGVTPETMQRFQTFRDLALDARRNNRNQQTALAQFRGSFWYFYMFT